jgi:hypothetical protein
MVPGAPALPVGAHPAAGIRVCEAISDLKPRIRRTLDIYIAFLGALGVLGWARAATSDLRPLWGRLGR